MKKDKRSWILLAIGLLISSSTFIIARYVALSDGANGFIKGIGIAIMLVALFTSQKARRTA